MNKYIWIAIVVTVAILGVVFLGRGGVPTDVLPSFSLETYEGEVVSNSDIEGVVVVNSWASWCPFCVKELPDFVSLQEEYDEITVVAINRRESLAVAKGYTDRHDISDGLVYLLDPDDSFYRSIGGFSMPETLFVRIDGTIALHKRGPLTLEEMREIVEGLLTN